MVIPRHTCANYSFVHFEPNYAQFNARLIHALTTAPSGIASRHQRVDVYALDPVLTCVTDDDGMWLEFGVWTGRTMRLLAEKRISLVKHRGTHEGGAGHERTVVGFDSFLGLPETWRPTHGHPTLARYLNKGAFSLAGQPPFNESDTVKWQIGWFNETLPPFVAAHPPETHHLTLLHIDSDLYSAASTVLTTLDAHLRPGVWIIFDELVNYPEYREGEMLALWEALRRRQRAIPGLGVEAVAVATHKISSSPTESMLQAAAVRLATRPDATAR